MKKILYALLFSVLVFGCTKPGNDDDKKQKEPESEFKKLVEKIDLIQNETLLGSFRFTYNEDKTIQKLDVELTQDYESGVCNLAGCSERYTFDVNSSQGKLTISRDRFVPASKLTTFIFDMDKTGRVLSGVNESNTNMTASYSYNTDGILSKFTQSIMSFDYLTQDNRKYVIEYLLGNEEGRVGYLMTPNMKFDKSLINIDLNMLLVCMKSTSSRAAGIAFLDPMFLGMFGYLGEREALVNSGSRGFQGTLEYKTDSEGSPIKVISNITVDGEPVVNSYEITYVK